MDQGCKSGFFIWGGGGGGGGGVVGVIGKILSKFAMIFKISKNLF